MRVCVVYDCLFPYTVGGGERWYRHLSERIAQEGHEVTYITLRQWDRGVAPELAKGRARVVVVGPRMALYTDDGRRRILPPLVFGLGVLVHLLLHGRRYEVVRACAFPYFSLLAAALVRPLGRYRLEVDWFEVWSDAYWRDYLGGLGGRIGGLVQRACARVRQHAFCFSALHAQRLRKEGLRGEVTVLRGLYTGAVKPLAPAPVQDVALFVGRLIPEKQAPLAVEAIALARARIPKLTGMILGDGPERAAVLEAIGRTGLGEVVSAPGFASAETVDRRMRQALCLLAPSAREGYGMVIVEAAAHATPSIVVAGPDNASVELIEDGVNGFVCPDSDPATIAEALVRVHEAGLVMRESTAQWFGGHVHELELESSLRTVLASYKAGDNARA